MTTPTIDTTVSPLKDARGLLADAITLATGYKAHTSYVKGFATPCFVLQPGGWLVGPTGVPTYKIIVTALYANQSGQVEDGVEELARVGFLACVDYGFGVFEVPAPGTVNVGDREYAGVQFTAERPVTIREI
jgi:hypothetical protein